MATLMERFRPWWTSRSPRERIMLLVMAGLLGVTLGWLLLVRPLGDALADARARHDRAILARAEAGGQADAIASLERAGPKALPAPVDVWIGQKASEAGFTVARVDPVSAAQATIVINVVRSQAFFAWVSELERRDGLIVEGLNATTNNDATLSVEATFRTRAK
ncbi:general secretion pathway protein M [Sphingomonas laterariae]|uniref:General secretion pathway protein M n=1 Tax=Edaphosphingomonas laterariae TaxID=861865 RepID=A0A239BA60_9SPHN|nr:type II secretion system protein GspM [Sphingomonas laterariae]SNS04589.1 general secretion pathway protein M [Sphingomonas laterariae]